MIVKDPRQIALCIYYAVHVRVYRRLTHSCAILKDQSQGSVVVYVARWCCVHSNVASHVLFSEDPCFSSSSVPMYAVRSAL